VNQYQQKQTITSHIKPLNIKITTNYDVGNPGPDLGQAQKYGGVKPIGTNYYHLQQKSKKVRHRYSGQQMHEQCQIFVTWCASQ
jgi:hypothetical protein